MKELLENKELLESTGLIIDDEYCQTRKIKMPLDFLDDIKQKLEKDKNQPDSVDSNSKTNSK